MHAWLLQHLQMREAMLCMQENVSLNTAEQHAVDKDCQHARDQLRASADEQSSLERTTTVTHGKLKVGRVELHSLCKSQKSKTSFGVGPKRIELPTFRSGVGRATIAPRTHVDTPGFKQIYKH